MRHDNVVPFDPARRGGLARRGSPDKAGDRQPDDLFVTLECPACAAALSMDASWLEGLDEILCGKCESEIAVVPLQERGAI